MNRLGLERTDLGGAEDRLAAVQRNFDRLEERLGVIGSIPMFLIEAGTPENDIVASPPAVCFVRTGGTDFTLWLKVSGTDTDTGWARVQTS